MLWDKFARILPKRLDDCRVFIPWSLEQAQSFCENARIGSFRDIMLPFPKVCIEIPFRLLNELGEPLSPSPIPIAFLFDQKPNILVVYMFFDDPRVAGTGCIGYSFGIDANTNNGTIISAGILKCRDGKLFTEMPRWSKQTNDSIDSLSPFIGCSLRAVHFLSDSSYWPVETGIGKLIDRRAAKKIKKHSCALSYERPCYLFIKNRDIHNTLKSLKVPIEDMPSRLFFGRRRHKRTLHVERGSDGRKYYDPERGDHLGTYNGNPHWVQANGNPRKIDVPACPPKLPKTMNVGSRYYKVITDTIAREPEQGAE